MTSVTYFWYLLLRNCYIVGIDKATVVYTIVCIQVGLQQLRTLVKCIANNTGGWAYLDMLSQLLGHEHNEHYLLVLKCNCQNQFSHLFLHAY